METANKMKKWKIRRMMDQMNNNRTMNSRRVGMMKKLVMLQSKKLVMVMRWNRKMKVITRKAVTKTSKRTKKNKRTKTKMMLEKMMINNKSQEMIIKKMMVHKKMEMTLTKKKMEDLN